MTTYLMDLTETDTGESIDGGVVADNNFLFLLAQLLQKLQDNKEGSTEIIIRTLPDIVEE